MLVPILVLKKHRDMPGQDWKGLNIGTVVRLSRLGDRTQIEFPNGDSKVFSDHEALGALARNGSFLTPESALSVLTKISQENMNEEFKRLLPPTKTE
jgi:hypothetical protein